MRVFAPTPAAAVEIFQAVVDPSSEPLMIRERGEDMRLCEATQHLAWDRQPMTMPRNGCVQCGDTTLKIVGEQAAAAHLALSAQFILLVSYRTNKCVAGPRGAAALQSKLKASTLDDAKGYTTQQLANQVIQSFSDDAELPPKQPNIWSCVCKVPVCFQPLEWPEADRAGHT